MISSMLLGRVPQVRRILSAVLRAVVRGRRRLCLRRRRLCFVTPVAFVRDAVAFVRDAVAFRRVLPDPLPGIDGETRPAQPI